jgi:hypothetical protein
LKLLVPRTQLKSTTPPAQAGVKATTEMMIVAPTRATDQDADDFSAARLVNTALSLRACADWIQSDSTLVSTSRMVFGSGFPANGTHAMRRSGESKASASESAPFWHNVGWSRNKKPSGRDGVVNFRTPPWRLNSLSA